MEAVMRDKIGRWMRLESALARPVANAKSGNSRFRHRQFKRRGDKSSAWVVSYPCLPAVGEKIRVMKASGGIQERYVQQVVIPGTDRGDGRSVLAVSKSPVMVQARAELATEPAPAPKPPPALRQRNPRVCEECEGSCRPGAGLCDACKAQM